MTAWASRYGAEWFAGVGALRRDVLAGMVGTFALIPEVIAFSAVAGVDPQVGLFASFVLGVVLAVAGGRPAMISGAAGSVALVAGALVASHGGQFVLAAAVLSPDFVQLHYAIEALRSEDRPIVLQFMSAGAGDGTSTVAAGFAAVAASERPGGVLLVCCAGASPGRAR